MGAHLDTDVSLLSPLLSCWVPRALRPPAPPGLSLGETTSGLRCHGRSRLASRSAAASLLETNLSYRTPTLLSPLSPWIRSAASSRTSRRRLSTRRRRPATRWRMPPRRSPRAPHPPPAASAEQSAAQSDWDTTSARPRSRAPTSTPTSRSSSRDTAPTSVRANNLSTNSERAGADVATETDEQRRRRATCTRRHPLSCQPARFGVHQW